MRSSLRSGRNQLTLAVVAAILGLLVVVQLRAQGGDTGLDALSAPELTDLVANLNTRNDQLRTEVATTQSQLDTLTAAQARGDTSLGQLQSDLTRVQGWSGLLPVSGPGVLITVSGPLPGSAADDLLNELHNAGSEAIAVGGVRVVPESVVAGDAENLSIEDTALADPFEVDAVGNAETLTGALARAGGIVAVLKATFPQVEITVTPVDRLDLPATQHDLIPNHGSPRL
ncbi:MAG: DUF881 domain-containing protein [Candidatus Limnocylindrales bacterium]